MNRNEVIKVYLITCSVIALLVVFSRVINNSVISKPPVVSTPVTRSHRFKFTYLAHNATETKTLNFANETVPVNDKKVDWKMARTLRKHAFGCVQSYVLQRSAEKWFPVIEPILKVYGIPEDFKYLPIVESGYCVSISSKGAAGVWQFMPGTARTYGLKVGHGRDERMDLRKSTIAACKYILELHRIFNSWTLAAAAYNNGEIQLARAMRKQNQDNYFRMHLNKETGAYVYNVIAMKEILSKPVKYGYKEPSIFSKPAPEFMAYN